MPTMDEVIGRAKRVGGGLRDMLPGGQKPLPEAPPAPTPAPVQPPPAPAPAPEAPAPRFTEPVAPDSLRARALPPGVEGPPAPGPSRVSMPPAPTLRPPPIPTLTDVITPGNVPGVKPPPIPVLTEVLRSAPATGPVESPIPAGGASRQAKAFVEAQNAIPKGNPFPPAAPAAPPPSMAYRAGQSLRPIVNALPSKLAGTAGAAAAGLSVAPYYHAITDEDNGLSAGQRLKMAADATFTGLGTIAGGAVGGGLGSIVPYAGTVAGGIGGAYLGNKAASGIASGVRHGLNAVNEFFGGSPDYISSVADDMKKAGYNPDPTLREMVHGNPRQGTVTAATTTTQHAAEAPATAPAPAPTAPPAAPATPDGLTDPTAPPGAAGAGLRPTVQVPFNGTYQHFKGPAPAADKMPDGSLYDYTDKNGQRTISGRGFGDSPIGKDGVPIYSSINGTPTDKNGKPAFYGDPNSEYNRQVRNGWIADSNGDVAGRGQNGLRGGQPAWMNAMEDQILHNQRILNSGQMLPKSVRQRLANQMDSLGQTLSGSRTADLQHEATHYQTDSQAAVAKNLRAFEAMKFKVDRDEKLRDYTLRKDEFTQRKENDAFTHDNTANDEFEKQLQARFTNGTDDKGKPLVDVAAASRAREGVQRSLAAGGYKSHRELSLPAKEKLLAGAELLERVNKEGTNWPIPWHPDYIGTALPSDLVDMKLDGGDYVVQRGTAKGQRIPARFLDKEGADHVYGQPTNRFDVLKHKEPK